MTDHSRKQLKSLSSRQSPAANNRIPVGRLERYGRLENDVVKAGEEIKSLARFIATQRTAFRKLLKKYKKWTGSVELEDRFRDEVLDDPKSFTKLDLGSLLDDYSATRQSIRALYEAQVQQAAGGRASEVVEEAPKAGSSTIRQLQEAIESGSKVFFDTSIATVPLGGQGEFASYFVHQESIIELQMLLLQHARFYLSRSRQNSVATPVATEATSPSFGNPHPDITDYHMLVADDLDRFAKEQSAITVNDRETLPGCFPQRAKASVRWNDNEDALATLRASSGKTKSAYLKKKHIKDFFDQGAEFSAKAEATLADSSEKVEGLRRELLKDNIRPLFHFSSCRSRLVGLDDNADGLVLATLDTNISIEKAGEEGKTQSLFPFALLLVRQEGKPKSELLSVLDKSHLVERVRGFSLEYHSLWQTHQPADIPAPFWLPILSQDIRKLPPPATKRPSTTGQATGSGTRSAGSSGSAVGTLDSTTAVETSRDVASGLETPPLKSFRKKKRRAYPEAQTPPQKYWSEYDNPEDDQDPNAYYIYVDPNETNAFDRFFERIADMFKGRKKQAETEPLLAPGTPPGEDEESSDEDTDIETAAAHKPSPGFGTFSRPGSIVGTSSLRHSSRAGTAPLPLFSGICFAASLAMLVMAYILRSTGRHKFIREVHFGIWFSMVCSLIFVLLGFMNVLRSGSKDPSKTPSFMAWTLSVVVLVLDVVGSGGLLAWMLG